MSRLTSRTSSVIAACALCVVGAIGAVPALAQIKPAMVRSVDEPARVPYGGTVAMTCPFTNLCNAVFPVVAAGKRVRVTEVSLAFGASASATHLVAVHRTSNDFTPVAMFQAVPFTAAYYGLMVATTQPLDIVFEAGETPTVEVGVSAGAGGINASAARATLTGYVVDVAP
jgi:hypothetical protein